MRPYFERISKALLICLISVALLHAQEPAGESTAARLVKAAKALAHKPTVYDPSYIRIKYPGGDPGENIGVCTDLVVRAYRSIGVDLQVLVHEDMKKHFSAYPSKKYYRLSKPDSNIDHRRVPNLMTFFTRHGKSLTTSIEKEDLGQWQPGDIVVFDLYGRGKPTHIGIISDRKSPDGRPLVCHHFPPLPSEEDCLDIWKVIGHYRYLPD